MSRFLGITRERIFSPGRVDDDGAILERVAERLRQLGHAVSVFSADDDHWPEPTDGTSVFTMCQGARALERLRQWHARGVPIINSPDGILNCQRHRTISAFSNTAVPFPQSVVMETGDAEFPSWVANGGAWIKRGDVHATESADVVRVHSAAEARATLRHFRERAIRSAVLQRHVPGTVLKFYAVRGRFFHCVPPPSGALAAEVLQQIDAIGQRAAGVLNLEVYGGDCVCDVTGRLTLIDLNDWPSYAACRAEAAAEIAAYLHAQEVASGR